MKTLNFILIILMTVTISSCEKNNDFQDSEILINNELFELSEADLRLKSGQSIYKDNSGNKYFSFNFNPDTLKHVYTVFFEKGKKYYLTVSGDHAYPIDMHLITSTMDTLFYGETVDIPIMKKYIVWESTNTDTMFITVAYTEDINFHTYYF